MDRIDELKSEIKSELAEERNRPAWVAKPSDPIIRKEFVSEIDRGYNILHPDLDEEDLLLEHDVDLSNTKKLSSLTLESIVNAVPAGVDFKDIVISLDCPRFQEYIEVIFERINFKFPSEEEMQKYREDLSRYEKNLKEHAEYQEWFNSELEKRLAQRLLERS